jgi:hypothetical protein
VKVNPSALKHGVSPEDAIQAAEWALWIEPLGDDAPPQRELRLGFDTAARLQETVVLVFEDVTRSSSTQCLHARNAWTSCPSSRAHP